MPALEILVTTVTGYVIGAIPSGVMIGRLRGVDPRGAGSGRTGTTNALRTLGPALAVVVLLLDVAKGVIAVLAGAWVARALGGDSAWAAAVAGVAAVVGHVRSVFIGFGGGRGVATGGGAILVLAPLALVAAVPAFALLVWRTRYVSLGSIAAAVAAPLATAVLFVMDRASVEAVAAIGLIGLVVVVAHSDNIDRLRDGTERRFGRG